jgi:hypothetical protein
MASLTERRDVMGAMLEQQAALWRFMMIGRCGAALIVGLSFVGAAYAADNPLLQPEPGLSLRPAAPATALRQESERARLDAARAGLREERQSARMQESIRSDPAYGQESALLQREKQAATQAALNAPPPLVARIAPSDTALRDALTGTALLPGSQPPARRLAHGKRKPAAATPTATTDEATSAGAPRTTDGEATAPPGAHHD